MSTRAPGRTLSTLVAAAFAVTVPTFAADLDGKTFKGPTGMMGEKKAEEHDTIKFEDGQFVSVGCQPWGFGHGRYVTSKEGNTIHFVADTFSEKEGRIAWVGTISGNEVDATYLWYKKGKNDKPEQVKWFRGKQQ
jgi:hypothetical protein